MELETLSTAGALAQCGCAAIVLVLNVDIF